MKTKIALAVAATLLAACGPDAPPQPPQPVYQQPQQYAQPAPAPVVIQQAAPQQSSGMQDMLVGGAIGALATHALTSNNRSAAPEPATHTRVIERTVVVRQAPPRVLPKPPTQPRPTYIGPAHTPRPTIAPRSSYTPPNRVVPSYKPPAPRRK